MLSDEEREALEILKGFEPDDLVECAIYLQAIEEIKNLVEKQSKEIEEAKQKEKKAYIDGTNIADKLCNKKWIDKIKAKIKQLDNEKRQWIEDRDNKHKDSEIIYAIEVLESLFRKGVMNG